MKLLFVDPVEGAVDDLVQAVHSESLDEEEEEEEEEEKKEGVGKGLFVSWYTCDIIYKQ